MFEFAVQGPRVPFNAVGEDVLVHVRLQRLRDCIWQEHVHILFRNTPLRPRIVTIDVQCRWVLLGAIRFSIWCLILVCDAAVHAARKHVPLLGHVAVALFI